LQKDLHSTQTIDVDALVEDVTVLLTRSIDKRIKVVHVPSTQPAIVQGDPSYLQNAVLNLGLNARDAMADGGTLRFVVDVLREGPPDSTETRRWVRLRVEDTGAGMAEEVLAQIFEPFFTTKEQGNGMGLAAVYGTIQAHDGVIRVESKPQVGTTFTIQLPVAGESAVEKPPATFAVTPRFDGLRVLLADDEQAVAHVAKTLLDELGCTVTVCQDGAQALAELDKGPERFDLILLDHSMPRQSGEQVLRSLRDHRVNLPVISASGYRVARDAGGDQQYEPDAFLPKPFDLKDLARAIDGVVRAQARI
jgi:CheY-like chemotaxis protein